MPDRHKLITVKGLGTVAFPASMPDEHIQTVLHNQGIPPELQRIQKAIGVEVVQGRPYGNAIATVADHEPHRIEINDPERFAKGKDQTISHETIHLWQSQLPGPLQSARMKDDPNHPYDISKIDEWRKQGKKLSDLPAEVSASIVQRYVASAADRPRLQVWINDLNTTPLSVMQPTSPSDKEINVKPRPPVPPLEAWMNPAELKKQAAAMQQKSTTNQVIK